VGVHRFDHDPTPVGSGLVETATWVIELGVGLACLVAASIARRNQRLRAIGILLLIAGIAAAGHAAIQLARNWSVLDS
jgi:putative copper export protein